jgi:hypothetical protein
MELPSKSALRLAIENVSSSIRPNPVFITRFVIFESRHRLAPFLSRAVSVQNITLSPLVDGLILRVSPIVFAVGPDNVSPLERKHPQLTNDRQTGAAVKQLQCHQSAEI